MKLYDNYPASSNADNSIGDYYLEREDKKKAIKAFKTALFLEDTPVTRKKLKEVQANIKNSR